MVNYDIPLDRTTRFTTVDQETYIHRIGRTGRFGLKGIAITLIQPHEEHFIREIESFYKYVVADLLSYRYPSQLSCSFLRRPRVPLGSAHESTVDDVWCCFLNLYVFLTPFRFCCFLLFNYTVFFLSEMLNFIEMVGNCVV